MGEYISLTRNITYQTKHRQDFRDITEDVQKVVKESQIQTGSVILQTHHTTCGVWINETEKNLVGPERHLGYSSDIQKVMDNFAHPSAEYNHDDIKDINNPNGKRDTHLCEINPDGTISECRNGYAHAQNLLIPSSLSMIIQNSELLLGKWQRVMLVELDRARERKLTILAQGVK